MPSIQEWATYGIAPGVLVGIIVLGAAVLVAAVFRYSKWFITWHTEQMEAQRAAHAAERNKLIDTILQERGEKGEDEG